MEEYKPEETNDIAVRMDRRVEKILTKDGKEIYQKPQPIDEKTGLIKRYEGKDFAKAIDNHVARRKQLAENENKSEITDENIDEYLAMTENEKDEEENKTSNKELVSETGDLVKDAIAFQKKMYQPKIFNPNMPKVKVDAVLHKFAYSVSEAVKGNEQIFWNDMRNTIIEIRQHYDKQLKKTIWGIEPVTVTRLTNVLESNIEFFIEQNTKNGWMEFEKTPSKNMVDYLFFNENVKKSLFHVNRFSTCILPFVRDGKWILPKKGYNPELDLYVLQEAPNIDLTGDVETAKIFVEQIFADFCFKTPLDKTMAIAGLLTPACRGLYERLTCRTPIFLYMANRERAGKDYLAGITGITYEGVSIDHPPLCSEDKFQNSSEELRKKITSTLLRGNKRLHFSNNRGKLKNVVLEQVTTSEFWEDRMLGKNELITLPNELEFSLSANIGMGWTPDFWHRCRPVNLEFYEEDPNAREFVIPDLHGYIIGNRGKLLSAIIVLINDWFINGSPTGGTFTSFSEWARVVGGIMKHHDLGDPTISLVDESTVGGDKETNNFKMLFEVMYGIQTATLVKEHKKSDMMDIIADLQQTDSTDMFSGWDFADRKVRTSFGMKFEKYVGRIFSNIKLILHNAPKKSIQKTYKFVSVLDKSINKNPKNLKNPKKPKKTMDTLDTMDTFVHRSQNEKKVITDKSIQKVSRVAKVSIEENIQNIENDPKRDILHDSDKILDDDYNKFLRKKKKEQKLEELPPLDDDFYEEETI